MALDDFLTQQADVLAQDPTASSPDGLDAAGGVDRSIYVTVATAVPCLVRPTGAGNDPRQERDETLRTCVVYFANPAVAPRRSNRLVIDGQAYEVIGPRDFNSRGELVAVDCRAVLE